MNPYDFCDTPAQLRRQVLSDLHDLDAILATEPYGPCREGLLRQRANYSGLISDAPAPPPVPCEWFALCTRPSAGTTQHPILGAVPICQPCADRHGLPVEVA